VDNSTADPKYQTTPLTVDADTNAEYAERWRRINEIHGPLLRVRDAAGNTIAILGQSAWFFVPSPPRKPKTHAVDRTRSPRWRAGSRRTKQLTQAAKRRGRRSPFADPLKGWTDLGWTTDETHSYRST
jgi:hypothetical protein